LAASTLTAATGTRVPPASSKSRPSGPGRSASTRWFAHVTRRSTLLRVTRNSHQAQQMECIICIRCIHRFIVGNQILICFNSILIRRVKLLQNSSVTVVCWHSSSNGTSWIMGWAGLPQSITSLRLQPGPTVTVPSQHPYNHSIQSSRVTCVPARCPGPAMYTLAI
jgi:hypothetical protein